MAKISVVIPVYNVEEYLDVCLDTVIMQTFKDFEVVCVNDGSTDSSGDILEKYAEFDKRIKVIHQKNLGLSGARNTGVSAANGKYVTFVDSDDFISPLMLEKLHQNIEENKSDFVFCNLCLARTDSSKPEVWDFVDKERFFKYVKKNYFCEEDVPPEVYFDMHVSAYAKLYRYDFIKDFKFPQGLIFEDVPYFAQCYLSAKRISFDFNPYYFYRVFREGSIISSADKRFTDIFEIQQLRNAIFKKLGKYEKYKTNIMIVQIKDLIQKISVTQGSIQEQMITLLKKYYGDIDFSVFNQEQLQKEKTYQFLRMILNLNYPEFKKIMDSLLKQGAAMQAKSQGGKNA